MEDLRGMAQQAASAETAMRRVMARAATGGGDRVARAPQAPVLDATVVRDHDVETLARLALGADARPVHALVEAIRVRPVPLVAIYLDLLQPAARKLGEWWVADLCTFADVTIGMLRLHEVLREVGPEFRGALECGKSGGQLLLTLAPGEQHAFGLHAVADFFVRAGWEVQPTATESAERVVGTDWFDVVGLSAGSQSRLDALAAMIVRIRVASRNREVGVIVGGPIFVAHPEYCGRVGADAAATDAREAPQVARALLDSIRVRID